MLLTSEQNKHVWCLRLTVLPYFLMCSMSNALFVIKSNTIVISGNCYYVDTPKTKFRRISTPFPRTFFDVISMVEKFTLFPRTFFDVISFIEISTVFLRTFFDIILMFE